MTTYFVLSSRAFCMKRSDKSYSPTACKIKPMLLYKISNVQKIYLKKKTNQKSNNFLTYRLNAEYLNHNLLIFR